MILRLLQYIISLVFVLSFVRAQAPSPGAVPLAIRSPHFNCWLPGSGLPGNWPNYWNANRILGWTGFIRIDGVTWEWLGNSPGNKTTLVKAEITPTRTILTLTAGPMQLEATFLSPVEPTDLVRQSFPFIYMSLTAKATDGASHSVQVYSDISAEWVSGDSGNTVNWSTTPGNDFVYHQAQRASPASMQEINDLAEDATVYYAMGNSPNMTWQTGTDVVLRGQFSGNLTGGRLSNTEDKNPRSISNNWPVFAHSMDLGSISEISTPVVWALGLVRDPTIRYVTGDGSTQLRSSYFWTQYKTIGDAIGAFIKDFPNALQRAIDLDKKITSDALLISQNYADLVSLSVRQTVGSVDITTSKGSDGQWNTSDILIFMKSVGDTSRQSHGIHVRAFPAYLYLNASWAGFLLKSSLQHQSATPSASTYAIPDLGILHHLTAHSFRSEGSGNMITMALAHAQSSGDGSLISTYYPLLKSWASYLATNALNQTTFITSDGQNNPNLAIKGIIGVRTMGEISKIVGQTNDSSHFKDQASAMLQDWENRAIPSNHIASVYGQPASWGLIYNLFSDRLLKLNFITQKIYSDQTNFYATQIPTAENFGLPYDSDTIDEVKSHWTMLTAATTTDNGTRDDLVSLVHTRAWLNNSTLPFLTDYNAVSGVATGTGGKSSPAQGAIFAPLALNLPQRSITGSVPGGGGDNGGSGGSGRGGKSKPNIGAIVGGTVAGIIGTTLLGLSLWLWQRRQKRKEFTPTPATDPFSLHLEIPGAEDTYISHPRYKGPHNSQGRYGARSTPTPSSLSTFNAMLPPHPTSSQHHHSNSQSTSTSGPLPWSSNEPSISPVTLSSSEYPLDGRPAPRDSKTRTSSRSQSNPMTSSSSAASPSDTIPPNVDVTRNLRNEVENLRREMAEIRAQRLYDINEAPPQYN
ncbi:hypothetical protein BD779DRAFT_1646537 [Infundibulicybe gibba]|nr:hypothetical protein BD779DRAFT_1646537 [Infundibulicybe gibba]